MRQNLANELKKREVVIAAIEAAKATSHIVYPPPSEIMRILKLAGVDVTWQYVQRRYYELNIYYERGLWLKQIE
jgi:uncharacterized ion transporter superfamily protein YfcC